MHQTKHTCIYICTHVPQTGRSRMPSVPIAFPVLCLSMLLLCISLTCCCHSNICPVSSFSVSSYSTCSGPSIGLCCCVCVSQKAQSDPAPRPCRPLASPAHVPSCPLPGQRVCWEGPRRCDSWTAPRVLAFLELWPGAVASVRLFPAPGSDREAVHSHMPLDHDQSTAKGVEWGRWSVTRLLEVAGRQLPALRRSPQEGPTDWPALSPLGHHSGYLACDAPRWPVGSC